MGLIVGLVSGAAILLCVRKKESRKRTLSTALFTMLIIIILTWTSGQNLNEILYFEEPRIIETTVTGKDKDRSRRHHIKRYLLGEVDGEEYRFLASERAYEFAEEGDILRVRYYEGAFGVPFYTFMNVEER